MKVIVYGAGGHGKVVADILIAGGDICRTGFKTQPAMNASENFFLFACEY